MQRPNPDGDRVEPLFVEPAAYIASKPYLERRLIFRRRVRPPYPRFLYKYKSLDTSDAIEHLRQILIDSDLWLSSPLDFNDPYDTSGKLRIEGTEAELKNRFERLMASPAAPRLTREARRRQEREMLQKPRSFWTPLIQESLDKQRASIGVACFATNPRSILMWSHYTSRHGGVCLQFEVARDPITMCGAIPVTYSELYPEVNWVRDDDGEDLKNVLLRKFDGWKYEGEHRMIVVGKAHKKVHFDPSALVGIIFGCEASANTIEKVTSLVGARSNLGMPDVRLFQAQKHGSRYAIRVYAKTS